MALQWQTTWDQSEQFTPVPMSSPITFGTPGPPASADIIVDETTLYQQIDGMGASLSERVHHVLRVVPQPLISADSSALTLINLKVCALICTIDFLNILGRT